MNLRTGSFCSGILAPEVAWDALGWAPQWFSEIDPFACAVEQHHRPDVENLGDMTRVNGRDLAGSVDLVVAGTPCQAFSVAGNRESLKDARGNLTLVFVELVHAIEPRWVVWENVPGVLSADDNAFGCFLAGLVGGTEPIVPRTHDGRWTGAGLVCGPRRAAAWRILDAQYVAVAGDSAVPQRRARVFVVSRDFGGLGELETPSFQRNQERVCGLLAKVLFEPDSLPRHSAPSRQAGSRIAASLTRGADSGGAGGYAGRRREDDSNLVVGCIDAHMGMGGVDDGWALQNHLVREVVGTLSDGAHMGGGRTGRTHTQEDLSRCLNAGGMGRQDFETETLIPVTGGFFSCDQVAGTLKACGGKSETPNGAEEASRLIVTHTLRADGFDASEDGTGRGTPIIPFDTTQITSKGNYSNPKAGDSCHPLASGAHAPAIAFAQNTRDEVRLIAGDGSISGALGAEPGMKQQTYIHQGLAVRRLTPVECERLQGFPDDYTLVPFRGKPAKDGPRYRTLGNSMAVPVLRWIGHRIASLLLPVPVKENT